jgi:hypothetical protein
MRSPEVSPARRIVTTTRLLLVFPLIAVLVGGCGSQDGVTPTSPDLAAAPTTPALGITPSQDPVVFDPVNAPFVTLGPTPTYIATPTTVTFTVTNTGTKSTGGLSAAITGTGAAVYSIKKGDNGCTGGLGATKSCTVKVTFAPTAIGTYLATLTVSAAKLKPGVSVNLSGFGGGKFTVQQFVMSGPDVTGDYSTTGGLNPSTFQLKNGEIQRFTALGAGSYTATLTMPPGYSLFIPGPGDRPSMECMGNWTDGNITVDAGTLTVGITILSGSSPGDEADCIIRIFQST